ncbi:MAG TPA: hydroxymethylbilane synthase [Bryobacteraceae bacterium]|nr:hydroxymethylbilane synthase [Bryobacteraceae bacterium]
MSELVIGSRGSKLALWQANHVAALLAANGHSTRIEIIQTTGDKITDVALSKVGTKGLFTKEIEEALLAGTIDLAVHSAKDMPTELPERLVLSAFPEREDARDALIGAALADLPLRAVVGTSSLRRAAQIRALRPDLGVADLRGNVDTRLRKQAEGQYAAILLAAAGLTRLGWQDRISEYLDPAVFVPAVGQGALAIETRADAGAGHTAVTALDNAAVRARLTAERAALHAIGGGCQVPLGAHAVLTPEGMLRMHGVVVSHDGKSVFRAEVNGPAAEAEALGARLGRDLLDAGAHSVLVQAGM